MPTRRKQKKSPLRNATEFFVIGVIAIIAAIIIPATSMSCSTENSVQLCFQTTYYGLDANTFAVILIVAALICFAFGVYYLMQHRKALLPQPSMSSASTPQPSVPQQPGGYPAYPTPQQQGGFPGDAPSQPPSNTLPPT